MTHSIAKPILIIQTAFIGDTILASSFARSVKELYPQHELHFFLRKGNEGVIQGLPFVDKVWVWDKGQGKVSSLLKLIGEMRKYQYKAVFNLHRHFNSGFVTARMKAERKIGFKENPLSIFYTDKVTHRIPHMENQVAWHETQRNLQLLRTLNHEFVIPTDRLKLRPVLPIQAKHREKVQSFKTQPFAVVAPASVWFTKQWEEANYTQLVAHLSKSLQVLLIGGPGDKELCERVKGSTQAINLCGQLNLLESAALMEGAERVFVNDSGPLHLASSVNAKTTTMFCATIPEFGYGPLADEAVVLESPEKLSCRPCGLHGHKACPEAHFKCGKNITVEHVLKTISQV